MKRTHETINPVISALILYPAGIAAGVCTMFIGLDLLSYLLSFVADKFSLPNLSYYLGIDDYRLYIWIILLLSILLPFFLKHFLLHKEYSTFSYNQTDYIEGYCLVASYVLPHVSKITFNKNGGYLLTYRKCYHYDDVEWMLKQMHKEHEVEYWSRRYNIPGTTCQVKIAISKHTAELILSEMQTEKFVVVETTLFGTGNPSCEAGADAKLEAHFICADDIEILESTMMQTKSSRLNVHIDLEQTMDMSKKYLELCFKLMHGGQELIFLPPKELANSLH